MSATCHRVCPSTSVKLPAATSVVPSGVTAIVSTRGVVPWRGAVKATVTSGSTAPVAASTAARPLRGWPPTAAKGPARKRRDRLMARSFTAALTGTAKLGSGAPVAASSLTSFWAGAPLRVPKSPPTNRAVPPGAGASASTARSVVGSGLTSKSATNDSSTRLVAGSRAKRPWRGITRLSPALLTPVKEPAT